VSCALEKALKDKKKEDVLFCTGSLYLVGEVKKLIECKSIENK
jgi:folylpolyglutamate synthase/dihydropteroate synthase